MTLIELLVGITVLAIVLTLAVPSFHDAFLNSKLTSQANGFLAHVVLARSEAIKTNARVTLCKSTDGESCTNAGTWAQGWIVFRDGNTLATVDGGDVILQRGDPLDTGFILSGADNVANYISFTSAGQPRLTTGALQMGTLTLCRSSPSVGSSNREVILHTTGRTRIQRNEGITTCP